MNEFSAEEAGLVLAKSHLNEGPSYLSLCELLEDKYGDLSDEEIDAAYKEFCAVMDVLAESLTATGTAYKTVIPSRSPVEKTYSKLGTAKSSISYSGWRGIRGGKLYELRHGTWRLLYDVAPGTDITEVPWNKK